MRNCKKALLVLLFTHGIFISYGQINLVPNPSFEQFDTCPYQYGQIHFAFPWFAPSIFLATVEYYNECASLSSRFSVPVNGFGNQNARTGKGYAGSVFYVAGINNDREYIEVKLKEKLILGKKYCASFNVSLADTFFWGISNIGLFLSNDSLLDTSTVYPHLIMGTPQVKNDLTTAITDKNNWTLISGEFIAQGGEEFLTIGNFNNDSSTLRVISGSVIGHYASSYYYIDDVSIIYCDSDTTIKPPLEWNEISFAINPNPVAGNTIIFNYHLAGSNFGEIEIFDAIGRLVDVITLQPHSTSFSKSAINYAVGLYNARLISGGQILNKKFIINK